MPLKTTIKIAPHKKITAIYISISIAWILLSDSLLGLITENAEKITWLQTLKGLFFVIYTGAILYVLVRADFTKIKKAHQKLADSHESTLDSLVRILDIRHKETKEHTDRVTHLAIELSKLVGIQGEKLKNIRYGATLHDIGKLGTPDNILNKPQSLTIEEWEIIKEHPKVALEFIKPISFLKNAIDIPYCHHEKWDGSGYPQGLAGNTIPIAARIFAIVDVWDALRSNRTYKLAWNKEKVISHMKELSGKHFDPEIVNLFLDNLEKLTEGLKYD